MTIAPVAPAALSAATLMQPRDPSPAIAPRPMRDASVAMHTDIVSLQTQVIVEANATTRGQAAQYDNRVTGATETVRSFDRIAMVEQGFEHMRKLFELANAPANGGEGSARARGAAAAAGVDIRV